MIRVKVQLSSLLLLADGFFLGFFFFFFCCQSTHLVRLLARPLKHIHIGFRHIVEPGLADAAWITTMQNPLRRPVAASPRAHPAPFADVERQRGNDEEPPSHSKIAQGHVVAMSGEFVGTIMFLFFAFGGTQIANSIDPNIPNLGQLTYISLSFGFSLAVTAWVFYRVSGGLFNPAVSTHPMS